MTPRDIMEMIPVATMTSTKVMPLCLEVEEENFIFEAAVSRKWAVLSGYWSELSNPSEDNCRDMWTERRQFCSDLTDLSASHYFQPNFLSGTAGGQLQPNEALKQEPFQPWTLAIFRGCSGSIWLFTRLIVSVQYSVLRIRRIGG